MSTSKVDKKTKRTRRDRREEILETASELFAEYGYKGTTIAKVSKAVDLTDPGLLHYFPTKESLLQGVLEYSEQKDLERYSTLLESETLSLSVLIDTLESLCETNEARPEFIRLFTVLVAESIRSNHPSHDYFVDRYSRGRKAYQDLVFPLLKDQIRADVDRKELAILILAIMDGLQIQWLLDPDEVDMVGSFKLFTRMITAYLKDGKDESVIESPQ